MTDPFDQATSEYPTVDDLGVNRLVLVYPKSIGKAQGSNGEYEYVTADVIPLDGDTNDKIDSVGTLSPAIEMRFQGVRTVPALKAQLKKRKDDEAPRPVLARMEGQPSRQNKKNMVWGFGPFTEADRELGLKAHENYIASTDPFA